MEIEHIIGFNLALLAAMASPGPAFLYQLKATLSGGRTVGIATGCGLAVVATTWILVALLGLDGLFRIFPWAYAIFKIIGALYLIYLALGIWRQADKSIVKTETPNTRAFLGGVLVNLANPKSVFFAAVLVVIFPPDLTVAEKIFVLGNNLAVEIAVYTGFAITLSTKTVGLQYLRAKPVLDRIAAVLLGALGIRLMLDR